MHAKHAQVIVKKPADYGSNTIGTKNAIDIAGQMPIVDLPLIFPRPNPTGSKRTERLLKRTVYLVDVLSHRKYGQEEPTLQW
jgi:hypothetical protein